MLDTFLLCYNEVLNRTQNTSVDADRLALVKTFVNNRHKEILAFRSWPFLQSTFTLNLVAPYSTGTITGTNGSVTVTGTGTSFVAGHAGWILAPTAGNEWYEVLSVPNGTTLTLKTPIATDNFTNVSYWLYQLRYAMPTDFRVPTTGVVNFWTVPPLDFVGMRTIMKRLTQLYFDYPREMSLDYNGTTTPQMVFYPPAVKAAMIKGIYIRSVADLAADADAIVIPEPYRRAIVEGALADLYRDPNGTDPRFQSCEQNFTQLRNMMARDYNLFDDPPQFEPYDFRRREISLDEFAIQKTIWQNR